MSLAQFSVAQDLNTRFNISFISCLDADTNMIEQINARGDFRFKDFGKNVVSLRCTDIGFAPDTTDLYYYFRQQVKFADSLNDDTLKVLKGIPIKFEHGFSGILYHFRVTKDSSSYDHIKIVSYSYGEMFGDFIYHHFSEDTLNYKDDSLRISELFEAYRITTFAEIREENRKIRATYSLSIDSLPFDNYWIQIRRDNGVMVRDTLRMADIDSARYKPRLTSYNITYRGRLNIEPTIDHIVQDFVLENLKSLEYSDNGFTFEVRDRDRGRVRKHGTLVILNSLGYPLELSFYFSYYNILLEKLY